MLEQLIILKLILLTFSFIGITWEINRKLKLNECNILFFVMCSIVCILFLGGIFDLLSPTSWIIFVGGLILGIKNLYTKQKFSRRLGISIGYILGFGILLTVIRHNIMLTHYDNFSHWALIVKEMLLNNQFPNSTGVVTFTSYPPGSALFIYYICRFIGESEWIMVMAQNIFILSAVATILNFNHNESKLKSTILLILSVVILTLIPDHFNQLLVDTLLGVSGLATTMTILQNRFNVEKVIGYIVPMQATLLLIKNSGVFFFIINIVLVSYLLFRRPKGKTRVNSMKKSRAVQILVLLLPLVVNLAWSEHVKEAFPNQDVQASKHAMSAKNYLSNFSAKSAEFREAIFPMVMKESYNLEIFNVMLFIGVTMALIVLMIIIYFKQKSYNRVLISTLLGSQIIYFIYAICNYFMYMFSMPEGEAIKLAGFSRYQATIIIYLIGLMGYAIVQSINFNKGNNDAKIYSIYISICSIFLVGAIYHNRDVILKTPNIEMRKELQDELSIVKSLNLQGDKILYYSDQKNNSSGYIYYMMKYELLSRNIQILNTLENEPDIAELLNQYSYVVIGDCGEESELEFKEVVKNDQIIGTYKINEVDDPIRIE